MAQILTEEELILFRRQELSQMTGVEFESITRDTSFEDLRLNSIHAMQMLDELEDRLGISISPIAFWENPTLYAFCKYIVSQPKS
jgi:acyl carrier protein